MVNPLLLSDVLVWEPITTLNPLLGGLRFHLMLTVAITLHSLGNQQSALILTFSETYSLGNQPVSPVFTLAPFIQSPFSSSQRSRSPFPSRRWLGLVGVNTSSARYNLPVGSKVKVSSYIPQYPVPGIDKDALHFTAWQT